MLTLTELEKIVQNCTKCSLAKTRTSTVFGAGDPNSIIMFIGEAPGYYEDKQGKPFVGKAGILFDKMLAAIDLSRKDIYIANVLKCRPPNNRNPFAEESEKCLDYLRAQVKIIRPDILVCLGAVAAKSIINKDFRITRNRGKWYEKGGFHIITTYHPAALLRDPCKKRAAWEDLKLIKKTYDCMLKKRQAAKHP